MAFKSCDQQQSIHTEGQFHPNSSLFQMHSEVGPLLVFLVVKRTQFPVGNQGMGIWKSSYQESALLAHSPRAYLNGTCKPTQESSAGFVQKLIWQKAAEANASGASLFHSKRFCLELWNVQVYKAILKSKEAMLIHNFVELQ